MASLFDLISEKKAAQYHERIYMDVDDFIREFTGLAGEVALGCAQAAKTRWPLHVALGAFLAMLEFYSLSDESVRLEIMTSARENMERIKETCEEDTAPSLIMRTDNNWDE